MLNHFAYKEISCSNTTVYSLHLKFIIEGLDRACGHSADSYKSGVHQYLLRGTEMPWNDLKWPKIGNSVTFRSLSATVLQGLCTVPQSQKCLAAFPHHFVASSSTFVCSWQYHLVWINLYVSCILILIVSFGSELQIFFPGPQAPPVHQCHSTITDVDIWPRILPTFVSLWVC